MCKIFYGHLKISILLYFWNSHMHSLAFWLLSNLLQVFLRVGIGSTKVPRSQAIAIAVALNAFKKVVII